MTDAARGARAPTDDAAARLSIARFGFWTALGTGVMTSLSFGVAIFTPPVSGQFCREPCIAYPYLDITTRFPRDYFWMFPAIMATLLFVALMVGLHARATPEKRPFATLAVVLSAMAGLLLVGDYFLQLAVIQPSLLAGETDGISLLTQYNPHGIFIALEELGYLLMALSLAWMAPAVSAASLPERVARWLFVGALVASLLALLWIALRYGHGRGYLFEVAVISIDWLVLIISSFALAVVFHRDTVRLLSSPLTAVS